jgi:hypothetical protein
MRVGQMRRVDEFQPEFEMNFPQTVQATGQEGRQSGGRNQFMQPPGFKQIY